MQCVDSFADESDSEPPDTIFAWPNDRVEESDDGSSGSAQSATATFCRIILFLLPTE